MATKLIASSLDNFIVLNNAHTTSAPYVTFTVSNPSSVTIIVRDALNQDGYYKEIVGSTTATTSSDSFNTGGVAVLNLMECLKMTSIFFNITLESANTIKTYIDTSAKYSITVQGSGVTVGGTFSNHNPLSPNKMVLMLQGNIDENRKNITMEKYNNDPQISFNISSPFQYLSTRYPLSLNITAYQMYDSKASMVTVPYSEMTILPTTLSKFQKIDYSKFYGVTKVHFLTNNETRRYNYGEHYGLSVLSDTTPTFKKNYYTNSGMFLETQTSVEYVEKNGVRYDLYDKFDLDNVEARYNHQVGYIDVYAVINGNDSYPVRYYVIPKCKDNNELFFVNEIGGIDSFNFTNTKTVEYAIDDQTTYMVNPIRDYTDIYELEYSHQKINEVTVTLSTDALDANTTKWLNELNKSKYVFQYLGTVNPKYKMVVVDKFDIEYNNDENEFELELEYHDADANIAI